MGILGKIVSKTTILHEAPNKEELDDDKKKKNPDEEDEEDLDNKKKKKKPEEEEVEDPEDDKTPKEDEEVKKDDDVENPDDTENKDDKTPKEDDVDDETGFDNFKIDDMDGTGDDDELNDDEISGDDSTELTDDSTESTEEPKPVVLNVSEMDRTILTIQLFDKYKALEQLTKNLKDKVKEKAAAIETEIRDNAISELDRINSMLNDYMRIKFTGNNYEENFRNYALFAKKFNEIVASLDISKQHKNK